MPKINKGDYFIAREGKRKYLARALDDSAGDTEAVLEKLCHIQGQRTTLTVSKKDIVLNLGPTPEAGKIYGLDVSSLYFNKKVHDDWGTINFFYRPSKEVVKDLWAALDKTYSVLKKRGLEFLADGLVWEVLPHNGEKYAGMYIKSKNDKMPDRILIRPEIMPASELVYVLLHELSHHMHLTYVTSKKLNALWLRLFNTSIKVATVKKETSAALIEQLLSQEDVPSAFKGQLDEEDALAFKWIVRTIGQVSSLSIKDLDTLFEADSKEDIRKVWPLRTIPRKELAPVISDYATKNYRETVAEACSYLFTGKKLPEAVVKLVEKTVSHAKANREG